jgi:hypothetical protein
MAEDGFAVDRSKASGRKSHCRACDARRAHSWYAEHREELYAQREAGRGAARQAHLAALAVTQKKKVAAAKKEHEAGVRRQRELLKSLGVPDLSPKEVTERARCRPQEGRPTSVRPKAQRCKVVQPRLPPDRLRKGWRRATA